MNVILTTAVALAIGFSLGWTIGARYATPGVSRDLCENAWSMGIWESSKCWEAR